MNPLVRYQILSIREIFDINFILSFFIVVGQEIINIGMFIESISFQHFPKYIS